MGQKQDTDANHPPGTEQPASPSAEQVAAYIASLAQELKVMADNRRLSALAYLLELVRMEAEDQQARPADKRLSRFG